MRWIDICFARTHTGTRCHSHTKTGRRAACSNAFNIENFQLISVYVILLYNDVRQPTNWSNKKLVNVRAVDGPLLCLHECIANQGAHSLQILQFVYGRKSDFCLFFKCGVVDFWPVHENIYINKGHKLGIAVTFLINYA